MIPRPPAEARCQSLADPDTLRGLARHLREGLYITASDGRLLDANPALLAMLGVDSVERLAGRSLEDFIVDPRPRHTELAWVAEHEGAVRELQLQLRGTDGEPRLVSDTVYACRDAASGALYFHGVIADLSREAELERQLLDQSMRDSLTGCHNRHYLTTLAKRFEERGDATWGCVYLDITGFREYNKRHGHAEGDALLMRMSRFLFRQVRAEECVVRLGADEFLIVLAGADEQRTESVARRLQLSALRTAPIAFSIGWAARSPGEPLERTIARADDSVIAVRVVERSDDVQRRESRAKSKS